MSKCPNCGGDVGEGYYFCKYCGAKLGETIVVVQASQPAEAEVKATIIRRLDALKNRDENAVKALVDEQYSKFDDWPPYVRQETAEALRNEFGAFKVLSNYSYEIRDLKVEVFGDVALATFHIHYQGEMRSRRLDVVSRVTSVLRKREAGWKFVHEHFSRFPQERRRGFFGW